MTEQQRKALLEFAEKLENIIAEEEARRKRTRRKQKYQEDSLDIVDVLGAGFSLASGAFLTNFFVDD